MRAVIARIKAQLADARWLATLAMYRLSRRRLRLSSDLFKAEVVRERRFGERVPGMTALTERAYFKWHAQETFSGQGTIVDLGSWFGSTTVALARGLVANPTSATRPALIHAFDRFSWEPWMEPHSPAGPLQVGDSFLPQFEAAIAPWRDRVRVHAGDLLKQSWSGEPIELLLVDAMKSWELAAKIAVEFFPALLVGPGHLIHQDFGHCFTPWIHLINYRLRSSLVPVRDVEDSETVVFRVARPIGSDGLGDLRRESFGEAEVEAAFEYSRSITRAAKHSGIYAARAMLAVYDDDATTATGLLNRLETEGKLSAFHAHAVRGAIEGSEG